MTYNVFSGTLNPTHFTSLFMTSRAPMALAVLAALILIMMSRAILAPMVLTAPILIVTSFATELVMPSVTDVRIYVRTDTLPHLIYKDIRLAL